MKAAMLGGIEGRGKPPKLESMGFQSRHPSLSTAGILR
jgi:hypothetical protein